MGGSVYEVYSEFPATALPASGSKDIISAIFGTPIRLSDANVVFSLEIPILYHE